MRLAGSPARPRGFEALPRILLASAALAGGASPLAAQGLLWSARYDSGAEDALPRGRPFRVDPSGGVTLAGQAGPNVFLARFAGDGTAGTTRVQAPVPPFGVTSVFIDEEDRAAMSGYKANGSMAGESVPLLMRFAFAGDPETLFTHFVGPLEGWTGRMVVGSGDGGLILNYDLVGRLFLRNDYVLKIGGKGPSWGLSSGGNICSPYLIAPDPNGGAVVGLNGSTTTFARFDANGAQAWGRSCQDTGWPWAENPRVGVVDHLGYAAVSGRSVGGDFLTARISPGGDTSWSKTLDGTGHGDDVPSGIATDIAGNVTVTGSSLGAGGNTYWQTVRYDALGNELWARAYDGGGEERPVGLALDSAGNTWVTGVSGTDVLTLKYDPNGGLLYSHRFVPPATPEVSGVAVDGWGNATVAFSAAGDVFVLRYGAPPTRVGPLSYWPVPPCRAFDSRVAGLGGPAALVGPSSHVITLAGVCGVPATAKAASVNLTVVGATHPGNLALFPADQAPPLSSSINYVEGLARANNATMGLGPGGTLGLRVNQGGGSVHVVVDFLGYWE